MNPDYFSLVGMALVIFGGRVGGFVLIVGALLAKAGGDFGWWQL